MCAQLVGHAVLIRQCSRNGAQVQFLGTVLANRTSCVTAHLVRSGTPLSRVIRSMIAGRRVASKVLHKLRAKPRAAKGAYTHSVLSSLAAEVRITISSRKCT
jgi:hypothetical protein